MITLLVGMVVASVYGWWHHRHANSDKMSAGVVAPKGGR